MLWELLTDKYVLSPRYAIDYRDNDIYVVTDEKGHCVPIDEYEEDYLYISIDLEKTDVYIASHTDDSEEPPIFVSALYSYNPRL